MESLKVNVGISNRHVHLTDAVFKSLFSKEDNVADFALSQKGEYASKFFVTLKGPRGVIEHVRVMGPNRSYNQVEIAKSDAFLLGIDAPVRRSGDLKDAKDIIISYNDKEILVEKCCILAQNHIHMNKEEALKWQVKDGQEVFVQIDKERKGVINAHIKVSDNGVLDFHVDRDEANAFLLNNGDEVEVRI